MKTVVVIPCRWASNRLPGKPLLDILKKPLIQRVYESATGLKEADRVLVATDDSRIEEKVRNFGGQVFRTSQKARTGSDRVAEIMNKIDGDIFLNWQGDELFINPVPIDELIVSFINSQPLDMGTLKQEVSDSSDLNNPNVVKVVTDSNGFALYFSRSLIPFYRSDRETLEPGTKNLNLIPKTYYKHMGIYIYTRKALELFSYSSSSALENCEKLEQLRALELGLKIKVWETSYPSYRIDTPEDLRKAESLLMKAGTL